MAKPNTQFCRLALIQSRARIRALNKEQRKIQVRMDEVTQGILNLAEGYEKPSEPVVPSATNAKRPVVAGASDTHTD